MKNMKQTYPSKIEHYSSQNVPVFFKNFQGFFKSRVGINYLSFLDYVIENFFVTFFF